MDSKVRRYCPNCGKYTDQIDNSKPQQHSKCIICHKTWYRCPAHQTFTSETVPDGRSTCTCDARYLLIQHSDNPLIEVRNAAYLLIFWLNDTGQTNKSRRGRVPADLLERLEIALKVAEGVTV